MSLVYEAIQVASCHREEPKPWDFEGRKGVSHTARLAVISATGQVASIKIKAASAEDLNKKVSQYTIGKPAKVPILDITPVFMQGRSKPSGYELTS